MTLDSALIWQSILGFLPRLITAIIIFVAGLILSKAGQRWAKRVLEQRLSSPDLARLIGRLLRWSILVACTILALDQVDFDVTTFLAGLGVAGLTVGLALQDIARNFVAGVILLLRRPFSIGDAVKVGDYAGKVMDVQVRDTTITTWNGEQVVIPNLQVIESAIINYSAAARLRRTIMVGIAYGSDVEMARQLFLRKVSGIEGVLGDPAPMCHAEELSDSAITLAVRFWVDHHESSLFDVTSNAIVAIESAAVANGIEIPFPICTVYMAE